MKKRAVLSILEDNPGLAKALGGELARVGLEVTAHLWQDDLQNQAWAQVGKELANPESKLWVIAGSNEKFAEKSVRQGLALAALAAQSVHGSDLAIIVSPGTADIEPQSLPTPLAAAVCVRKNLGAKAAVMAARPGKKQAGEYRLTPHALPGLGLWLELGPTSAPWKGAFLAASGCVPDVQGVGPAGTIPANSTLHYPVRGIKLELGGVEMEGNGLANEIGPAISYYVRLGNAPEKIVFGPFPDNDEAELYSLGLC